MIRYLSLNKYQLSSDDEAAMILGPWNIEINQRLPCGAYTPEWENGKNEINK